MLRIQYVLFILIVLPFSVSGQYKPGEGTKLNYRIIGFSFPQIKNTEEYIIQIAPGYCINEDSFQKSIIITAKGRNNKVIAEVPDFGKEYTWRVINIGRRTKVSEKKLHHFSTLMPKWVNPDSVRLRIITPAKAHKDDYVFLDGNKALYDMEGNPVWYMPKIESSDDLERPRDIKITPFGTVTTLIADQVYEVNYDGHILWKGPGPGKLKKNMDSITNLHHHEITRLANGNYMTFGFEHAYWPVSSPADSVDVSSSRGKIIRRDNKYYQKITFGKLIEYDHDGKIIWEWHSADYIKQSDLYARTYALGIFDLDDTHANAFYFDEKKKTIYVSFRNLYRVIKIEYPSGKLLATFGARYVPGAPHTPLDNGLFCGQHSCRESQDGYLYVFNNNICNPGHAPTIVMIRESPAGKDSMEQVWEYECPMDEMTPREKEITVFNVGGNVIELPDRTIFCCMGSAYGKTLIVSPEKEILWCAQPEMWKNNKWSNVNEYRGSIITRNELEKLIWDEPLAK